MFGQSEVLKNNEYLSYFKDSNLVHFTDSLIKFRYILCGFLFVFSLGNTTIAHAVICQNVASDGALYADDHAQSSNLACGGAFGGPVISAGDGSTAIGGNGAQALVGSDVAIGSGAVANGIDNAPTPSSNGQAAALGPNSHATGNAAIGIGRDSNATGSQALAVGASSGIGDGTTATGYYATAIGGGAVATGDTATAIGAASLVNGIQSTGLGYGAQASGDKTTALGAYANAGFAQSTAIGVGATTTATNQMMLGTAATTYTAPGITSAASTAAQSGGIKYVTTDASGNLAATDAPTVDLSGVNNSIGSLNNSVNLLGANVSGLWQNVGALKQSVQRGYEGSAVAISQTGPVISRDSRFGISAKWGTFRGQNAFGAQAQYRVNNNIVLSAGVGAGFRYGGVGGGAGGLLEW